MTLHDRVKIIRKESGLTQAEFGQRIGITFSSVSLIEKGKNNPSEQTIRAICSEFSVNRDWLVDGVGEMQVQKPLLPEIIHNLRKYPHVLELLAAMSPEDWLALDALLDRVIEQKNK
jgi:transcriptional regulator with XRE-family HTH domain